MKRIPQVVSAMTPFPYSIDIDAFIVNAREMMAEHNIRHLPVKHEGRLIGVVSDRDIGLALGPGLNLPSSHTLRVRDICAMQAYIVDLSERLDVVLLHMAEHHIGSALVTKDGRLAGIFTMTDACRAYGQLLRSQFPVPPDNDHDVA